MPTLTKRAIEQAFWGLLEQRPLSQITVKDVTDRCGITRNSFYYYYRDIPTLIEEIITDQAEQIISATPSFDSLETCLLTALRFATQHRRAIIHVYNSVSRALFEDYLWSVCNRIIELYYDNVFGNQPLRESDRALVIRYYRCLCFGAAMDWIRTDTSQEEAARRISRFCQLKLGATEEMIRRCME